MQEKSDSKVNTICWDKAATMMDVLPPLLRCCHPPHRGLLLQQDDRVAGTKNAAASVTTAGEVGIVTRAMASSGTVTNTMDVAAWWQRP
jgi:hypothetical protein